MFSRIRKHLNPTTVVAFLALSFAMTGGAFAMNGGGSGAKTTVATASKNKAKPTTKAGPKPATKAGPRGAAGPQGEAGSIGPQGPGGPAGPNGKNGENGSPGSEGLPGKSVVGRPLSGSEEPPAGPCKGLGGSEFEVNGAQTYACNGKIGTDGEKGEPWTPNNVLPSKATETGGWTFGDGNASTEGYIGYPTHSIRTAISFPIPLSAALEESNVKGLKVGEGETIECPGTVTKPEAAPGYLCVYSGELTGLTTAFGGAYQSPFVKKLSSGASPEGGANTSGAMLFFYQEEATAHGNGTWAVTAP